MPKLSVRNIIILIVLIAAGVVGYFLYSRNKNIIPVETVELENVQVQRTVSASGVIKSKSYANLAFSSSGKIVRLNAEEDEYITKGKTLAQLSSFTSSQTVQAAKDARDVAIRDKDLYLQANTAEKDDFYINVRRLDELISRAEAIYQAELGRFGDLYIHAPFDGTIIDITKKEGEIATLSETIIKLADLDNLFFEVKLDQEDFGLVNIGQNVKVDLDSYENFSFIGKVSHLPNFADSSGSTQEFIVEITVDPSENRPVLLGMTGEASIIVSQTKTEVPVLQFDTIFTNVDEKYSWTVENGVTKKRIIQTGLEGDLYTEIKEDLTGVQIVIPTNNDIEIEEGKTPKWQSK